MWKSLFLTVLSVVCLWMPCNAIEDLPRFIDYSSLRGSIYEYFKYDKESLVRGYCAFNFAPEVGFVVSKLKKDYQISTAVETGTFHGGTTVYFSVIFDDVHTIDVNQECLQQAKADFKDFNNIKYHLGSSETVFKSLLPELKDKTLFVYLDAHWGSFWPLLDELEELSLTHKDNCIVMIDDFKVPGRPEIPYDRYGHHECSYEYVKPKLEKLFSSYSIHYIIPRSILSRAKLLIVPKRK